MDMKSGSDQTRHRFSGKAAHWSHAAMTGLAILVAITGLSAAFAEELKPDASVKSRIVEASVFLDDRIKADAALAADCLSEGRKWIDKNAAETTASRKEDPQLFKDGGWTFERKYDTRSVVDGIISASSDPTIWTPTPRIPIRTSVPSCGIRSRKSASRSVPSSPRPPITARR